MPLFLILGSLAVAKGIYFLFGSLTQIRNVIQWWCEQADEITLRSWRSRSFRASFEPDRPSSCRIAAPADTTGNLGLELPKFRTVAVCRLGVHHAVIAVIPLRFHIPLVYEPARKNFRLDFSGPLL